MVESASRVGPQNVMFSANGVSGQKSKVAQLLKDKDRKSTKNNVNYSIDLLKEFCATKLDSRETESFMTLILYTKNSDQLIKTYSTEYP